jgi:hypothetical protein
VENFPSSSPLTILSSGPVCRVAKHSPKPDTVPHVALTHEKSPKRSNVQLSIRTSLCHLLYHQIPLRIILTNPPSTPDSLNKIQVHSIHNSTTKSPVPKPNSFSLSISMSLRPQAANSRQTYSIHPTQQIWLQACSAVVSSGSLRVNRGQHGKWTPKKGKRTRDMETLQDLHSG